MSSKNPFGPDQNNYRVTTHKPTGDLVLVQRIDFREGVITARRVVETRNGYIRKSDIQELPLAECERPYLIARNAVNAAKLWDSGIRAVNRDRGCGTSVRRTRGGNRLASSRTLTPNEYMALAEDADARGQAAKSDEYIMLAIAAEEAAKARRVEQALTR